MIPGEPAKGSPAEQASKLAEQRRVFYVALTRPTKTLVLSSFTQLPLKLAKQMNINAPADRSGTFRLNASRYFAELGPAAPAAVSGQAFLAKHATPPTTP